MTAPKRHVELEGKVRLGTSLEIPLAHHELHAVALDVALLAEGHASRLTLASSGDTVRLERAAASSLAIGHGAHFLGLSDNDLEVLLTFLLVRYRDGAAYVDHVDLEVEHAAVTVFAEPAKPPPAGDALRRLQRWYLRQCDGDWEHGYGVDIGTLDNPGWRLKVNLTDTDLAERAFERRETHRPEDDWVVCWVEDEWFHAACGPLNLDEAIEAFLEWEHDSR